MSGERPGGMSPILRRPSPGDPRPLRAVVVPGAAGGSPSVELTYTPVPHELYLERAAGRFNYDTRPLQTLLDASSGRHVDHTVVSGQHYAYRARSGASGRYSPWTALQEVRTPGLRVDYVSSGSEQNRVPGRRYWSFASLDGARSYRFARNPHTEASPFAQRNITWDRNGATGGGGTYSGLRAGRAAVSWEFSGIAHDRSQHQAMLRWLSTLTKIRLTTDLGEVHLVRLLTYTTSQTGGGINPDRNTFSVSALLYDEVPLYEGISPS